MRGAGYDASYVGEPDAAALRAAGAACSGKECLPYQLIWGSFARFLDEEATRLDGKKALFLSAGNGFQACRANLFPLTEQISLERLGLGDRIEVADFSLVTGNVAHDARRMDGPRGRRPAQHAPLLQLRGRGGAGRERRAVRGVLGPAGDDARAAPAGRRPGRQRDRGLPLLQSRSRSCSAEAARAYRRCRATRRSRRACATSTSAATCTCASTSGATTTCSASSPATACASSSSPYGAFFELLQLRQIQDGVALTKRPEKEATLATMRYVIGRLVKAVRAEHPWVFWNEVRDVDRESRRLVAPYPFGESIPTVGGALLTWRTQPIDGVVSVAPRGCGPALIAEAQLRREAGLPALFVYADGDPIDEARLAGFAWRLRSRPARRVAT